MAYTVLARKYRSWTFDELVGQQAVATTLKNAINCERIHHGFLFTGTRGVGKTSAARVLARSLNCLKSDGPTVTPCCKCESCLAIAEGQDVDVIEIDAASNTGVDNIRELRSNTIYRPARARFKIYIIDEVHMLSTGAFNALLKTLEEPPEHVKFILATTEPQKVPATIQSRCLRFDFRSISPDDISGHFRDILKKEGVQAEDAVVRRVARLANGSMRDGLSLLDQLLSSGQPKVTLQMVDDLLPTPHDEMLTRLIQQMADRQAGAALATLDKCMGAGYTLERFTEALAEQLRTLMLLNVCGAETDLVELPGAAREAMITLSKRFDSEAYVHMIAVLEELRRNVRFSALGRALTEAALVRLASGASYQSVQALLDQLAGVASPPAASGSSSARPAQPAARAAEPTAFDPKKKVISPATAAPQPAAGTPERRPAGERESGGRAAAGSFSARVGRAAAPAQPTQPVAAPKGDDMREAANDPLVRAAMDLFNGSLVNVERLPEA
jgi:DNA polymerase III subunit gamma/tau